MISRGIAYTPIYYCFEIEISIARILCNLDLYGILSKDVTILLEGGLNWPKTY